MDVLVPIAAKDPAFKDEYDLPKPLIEIRGQPMIKWATSCVDWVSNSSYTFPVLTSHIEEYRIDERLRDIYGSEITIIELNEMTDGAAVTALQAKDHLSEEELIILFGDQYICAPVRQTVQDTVADGVIAVFESSESCWSYAQTDDDGTVRAVAEKEVISTNATAGLYYFKQGSDFVQGAEQMIRKDIRTNSLFYVCPVYDELIEMDRHITVFNVNEMWSLGTPTAVARFKNGFRGE
jgi:NDP-sugar pyrophosphorylase family protein